MNFIAKYTHHLNCIDVVHRAMEPIIFLINAAEWNWVFLRNTCNGTMSIIPTGCLHQIIQCPMPIHTYMPLFTGISRAHHFRWKDSIEVNGSK